MSVRVERAGVEERERTALEDRFRAEGLTPQVWGNGPGDRYGWHRHDYHKVLLCVSGSIVFHTGDGDVELQVMPRPTFRW